MTEKQKPEYNVVKRAAILIKHPEKATPKDIKQLSSRALNDEKNSPQPNKLSPKPTPRSPTRPKGRGR